MHDVRHCRTKTRLHISVRVLQFLRKIAKIYVTGVDFLLTLLEPFCLHFKQNEVDTACGDINNSVSDDVTQSSFDLMLKVSFFLIKLK